MTRIAHLSDTHFGTELPQVAEALLDCLTGLRPDLTVVSGDVTQRARPSEFAAAVDYFRRLPSPFMVLPGNHDIPLFDLASRLLRPYRNFRAAFRAGAELWQGEAAAVLGLDTTLPLRHTRGRLDTAQLSRLTAQLPQEAAGKMRISAVHQPLHAAWPEDRDEVLLNAEEAAHAFARERIDVVLSGHVHVPVVTTTRQLFPRLRRHFILAGAGTAISYRTRPGAPNSFNLLSCEPGQGSVEVQSFHFAKDSRAFHPHARFAFSLALDGWTESSV
ncbi:metallophosphoesterase family protein [Noviherbaspirillum aridicola]|uniref:DNA repair exonuclease n=1 Tax=Noviherbaspirillum aridicola TaxID=2849687 RepID=A0ABQ4Q979_9BURK|nr:metallophosphoesterase [Noviherbaspirillum aridicola]GIZ53452.1 DNA repair exonuclease [Noviherbaspirillum aridicola]